jgi:hypothetical protein
MLLELTTLVITIQLQPNILIQQLNAMHGER